MNSNWNQDDHRLNVNGNNRNGCAFGITLASKTFSLKTYNNLYSEIISEENLYLAYKKARRLKNAVRQIKFKTYGYKAYKKVFNALMENGPNTSQGLAIILNRDKRTVGYHLERLLKKDMVDFKKVWKKYTYEYLWCIKNDI